MIIDTTGKIVFKGHPANRPNLEEDFDKLLKGEPITGAGTESENKPDEKKEGEGEDTKDAKVLDSPSCLADIDKFKEEYAPALQKDEKVAAAAKAMPRAFCVMVYEESYDVSTEKSKIDWKNYRVLVGKQADIDACKEAIEKTVPDTGYEVVLRENAI